MTDIRIECLRAGVVARDHSWLVSDKMGFRKIAVMFGEGALQVINQLNIFVMNKNMNINWNIVQYRFCKATLTVRLSKFVPCFRIQQEGGNL